MKSGVSGVEIRDNIGMSRVKQTPQNMTWQAEKNATNRLIRDTKKVGAYVAYGPGPNATYTIRDIIFFLKFGAMRDIHMRDIRYDILILFLWF